MKCVFGRQTTDSNKQWDSYLHINNFGYYENSDVTVSRKDGRSDYQIIVMTDGEGIFSIGNENILVKEGFGVLYRPGETQVYSGKNCSFFRVHFSGYETDGLLERMEITKPVFEVSSVDSVLGIYKKMLNCTALLQSTTEDMLCAHFITLLGKLSKTSSESDEDIMKVINQMKSESFKGLSSKEYAKIAKLSEYHFIRKFKRVTGSSPAAYKAKIIAEKAAELMENTDMNVTEIAASLGFDDALYFSRFFKKNVGISPKKYMEIY